jgi:hypothetical protein
MHFNPRFQAMGSAGNIQENELQPQQLQPGSTPQTPQPPPGQQWTNPMADPDHNGMFNTGWGWQEDASNSAAALGYDSNPNGTFVYSTHLF